MKTELFFNWKKNNLNCYFMTSMRLNGEQMETFAEVISVIIIDNI